MQVFITGTDTNIGKTIVCSWLCLHTKYDYFKPIQTGSKDGTDSHMIATLSGSTIYPESYIYQEAVSPHLAARLHKEEIELSRIQLPASDNLIVEGAGGVFVPINQDSFMIDLIKQLNIPVILVSSSHLGTINHTVLSLEALRRQEIPILGVILNGDINSDNCEAIEFYGKVKVLAQFPLLHNLTKESLQEIVLGEYMQQIFKVQN